MVINRPIPSEVITQMGNLGRPAPAKDRVGVFAELDYFLFAEMWTQAERPVYTAAFSGGEPLSRSSEHTPFEYRWHWRASTDIELFFGPCSKARQASVPSCLGNTPDVGHLAAFDLC